MRQYFVLLSFGLLACSSAPAPLPPAAARSPNDTTLASIAAIHGGAGPWLVAGYRMGSFALAQLGLSHGSSPPISTDP